MKSISVYTTTYNAIEQEYCVLEGIKSALMFADEVVVLDSHSTDGTVDRIMEIGDLRIKIYYTDWIQKIGWAMYKIAKSMALGYCTSDWCVLMDADEVFHECDFEKIRSMPVRVDDDICAIRFNTIHFYKDYRHTMNGSLKWKDLYEKKVYMVKNYVGIHHGNSGYDIDAPLDRHGIPIKESFIMDSDVSVYHYGHVRSEAAYLKKQNRMHGFYEGAEKNDTSIKLIDDSELGVFTGTHPRTMKERIMRWK